MRSPKSWGLPSISTTPSSSIPNLWHARILQAWMCIESHHTTLKSTVGCHGRGFGGLTYFSACARPDLKRYINLGQYGYAPRPLLIVLAALLPFGRFFVLLDTFARCNQVHPSNSLSIQKEAKAVFTPMHGTGHDSAPRRGFDDADLDVS